MLDKNKYICYSMEELFGLSKKISTKGKKYGNRTDGYDKFKRNSK